jgi:hypothetical protein
MIEQGVEKPQERVGIQDITKLPSALSSGRGNNKADRYTEGLDELVSE